MTAWLRRAGRGELPDRSVVVWSVAEGRRGRRWREVRSRGASVVSSLLLETDPGGRFAHLEASTASGLITLHPEPDATLHGNVVTDRGVEPVEAWPWPDGSIVLLDGSPLCLAAAVLRLRESVVAAATASVPGVLIALSLDLNPEAIQVHRVGDGDWSFRDGLPMRFDDDGLPTLLDAQGWPLEEG